MKLMFCGDVVLGNNIEKSFYEGNAIEILNPVKELFSNADLVVANIECPITNHLKPYFKVPHFLRAGKETVQILKNLNIMVGSLANNHIIDYGKIGLKDTMKILDEQKIIWLGAGWTNAKARAPKIIQINNERVGIIAVAQEERSAANINGWGAGVLESEHIINSVKSLKNKVDLIICCLHFGVEFSEYPTPSQIKLCHSLIDEGANLVIGHHPHVPQGYEFYKEGLIAYSLGNFIFDMEAGPHKFSRMGLVVNAEIINKKLNTVKIIPFNTNSGFPLLYTGNEKKEALKYLDSLNNVIENKEILEEKYYLICRNNFYTSVDAFIKYGIIKMNIARIISSLKNQFRPQIFKLRKDYLKFLFNGMAIHYEKLKDTNNSKEAFIYLTFCKIFYFFSLGWFFKLFIKINKG